jgi:hypothetical protein
MAIMILRADQTRVIIQRDAEPKLDDLYQWIGCDWIETVTPQNADLAVRLEERLGRELEFGPGTQMVMDENGVLSQKPLNVIATMMAGQPILGDVVLLSGHNRLR